MNENSEYMTIPEAAKILEFTYSQMYWKVRDSRIESRYMPQSNKGRGKTTHIKVARSTVELWRKNQIKERRLRANRERKYAREREERQDKMDKGRVIFEGLFPEHTIFMNSPTSATIDDEVHISESGIFGPYLIFSDSLSFVHKEELLEVVEMLLKFRKRKRARDGR